MADPDAEDVDSELERIRIELVMLRAEKVRNNLARLGHDDPDDGPSITPTDIRDIDRRLEELENDARKLVESLPRNDADQSVEADAQPLVLTHPAPEPNAYRIEEVMAKLSHRLAKPGNSE